MEIIDRNMDELNNDSILQNIDRTDLLFNVPKDYFSGFSTKLLSALRLKSLDRNNHYSLPDNYFSTFPDKILNKIKTASEDAEDLSFLDSLPKGNVYTVPDGYFDNLTVDIPSKTIMEEAGAKVIQLRPRRNVWRMAVAAAVISGVVLSGGLFLENRGVPSEKQHRSYASVIDNSANIQEDLSNISTNEIANYLNTPDPSDNDTIIEGAGVQEAKKAMSEMSNDEMENYLDKTPTIY
ncbi:hypothetical protein A9P82_14040 [Arachidicoccus ginsenosidimutans]|uniref:hypothetical protein n=1 Tax=Arachidicoccus sp. BS20 TaxID=1850526 RepID=UPI0007F0B584|nr:hypothetical protein [Arachidicoccus sp. BS20]ANI90314.1 hypothetical protein A9P82_14040 [Arachidicoccus sp. BS20]